MNNDTILLNFLLKFFSIDTTDIPQVVIDPKLPDLLTWGRSKLPRINQCTIGDFRKMIDNAIHHESEG